MSGALDTSVTLDDVFTVVVARRVPLAPELAGYLVLEIAERADPNGGDLEPKSVFVGEEGTVALVKPKREGATGDAEASIRSALARLLEASGSQTPALAAASKRKSGAGLSNLAEELEAALIPVNRAAGRRALARLAREVRRVTLGVGRNAASHLAVRPAAPASAPPTSAPTHAPSPLSAMPVAPPAPSQHFSHEEQPTTTRTPIPNEVLRQATPHPVDASDLPAVPFDLVARTPSPFGADVDSLIESFAVSGTSAQHHARELKALVGLEPTAPPPEIARRMETREVEVGGTADVEALLSMGAETPAGSAPEARPWQHADPDERQLPTGPSEVRRRASQPSPRHARRRRGSGLVAVLAVTALAAGAYGVWRLRPGIGAEPAPRGLVSAATGAPPLAAASQCKGRLVVTDVPAHAEVLLRAGQAPVDVPNMPVGTRLEFVATAEGYSPKRAVVPAGASWDTGPNGKPRFEAALQLDRSKARPGTNDPWPAGEPGSAVGGEGPPGTVHVVATPRGAEIWMLVAIGPEARIDQLHCEQDFDVLIAGPTTYRKRLHVASSDFAIEDALNAPATPAAVGRAGAAGENKLPTRVARVSAK